MLLVGTAAAQRWVPMTRWAWILGESQAVPPELVGRVTTALPTSPGNEAEREVVAALQRARRLLPFQPSCLAQAGAAQVMLRRRGSPGTLVIGLRPPADPGVPWMAHAWLIGSVGAVTGGPAAAGFTATSVFRPEP